MIGAIRVKTVIVSGGTVENIDLIKKYIKTASYIICADSGFDVVNKIGIKPNLCIGDMDSVKSNLDKQNVKIYPQNKDYTDTELAVNIAIEKGSDEIIMLGCTGTRLDHTLANIMLLKTLIDKKIKCLIVDSHNKITLCNSHISLSGKKGNLCSLIPITKCISITTTGLLYPLKNECLLPGSSRGISNIFNSTNAKIELKSGYLLVIRSCD